MTVTTNAQTNPVRKDARALQPWVRQRRWHWWMWTASSTHTHQKLWVIASDGCCVTASLIGCYAITHRHRPHRLVQAAWLRRRPGQGRTSRPSLPPVHHPSQAHPRPTPALAAATHQLALGTRSRHRDQQDPRPTPTCTKSRIAGNTHQPDDQEDSGDKATGATADGHSRPYPKSVDGNQSKPIRPGLGLAPMKNQG